MSAEVFAAAIAELYDALDWHLLGDLYCHAGGAEFFAQEERAAALDASLQFASDVARSVPSKGGASLYIGAAVAELAPMISEQVILHRPVHAFSLPGPETAELNRALQLVAEHLEIELPTIRTEPFDAALVDGCDHLWMVSVLTDPDHFPALHDALYERAGTDLATARGSLAAEGGAASALVERALDALRTPALVTTTDEELAFFRAACTARSWTLEVPERARLSAIVGDAVRLCRVRQ